ncbi:MAG: FIST C-terminal domain-containing protein [Geminicoccaceae bacterium]
MLAARARAVAATGRSWHLVLGACLDQLDPLPAGANLGILYLSEALAPVADEVLRAFVQRTGVTSWLGASGHAVLGGAGGDGICALVLSLPADRFVVRAGIAPDPGAGMLVVHGEIAAAGPASLLAELGSAGAVRVAGGLVADRRQPVQIADGVVAGCPACLELAASHPAVAGLATAGSPLGPAHRVTSAVDGEILSLDGRPALSVMTDELGDLFRHSGRRFAPELWVSERADGSAGPVLRMRRIIAVDEARGAMRVEGGRHGRELRLMRPDPAGSLARLRDLTGALLARLGGSPPVAALYFASRHRGQGLFGPGVDEVAILRERLGRIPLAGLVTDAEIFDGAMHEAAGVLVLFG